MRKSPRTAVVLGLAGMCAACLLATAHPTNRAYSLTTSPAAPDTTTDRAAIAAKVRESITSSPVLHLTVRYQVDGTVYDAEGWMTATKVRGQVRQNGVLLFARFFEAGRAQEFVPQATFPNGTQATNVILEYRTDPVLGFDEWPRLIDQSFACGPGCVATDSWLQTGTLSVPDIFAEHIQNGELSETILNAIDCYVSRIEVRPDPDTVLTKELYINKTTFKPVRQKTFNTQYGMTIRDTVVDYTLLHLSSEAGIQWELKPDNLR